MIVEKTVKVSSEDFKKLLSRQTALPITPKEWESMIESALSFADRVEISDNVRGDLQKYFRRVWSYWPIKFEVSWEVVGGNLIVLSITASNMFNGNVTPIHDTAEFRGLYVYADELRRKMLG